MDIKEQTDEAIRHLSKLNEMKVKDDHFTVQELFPTDQIEKETRELKEWDWDFRKGEMVIGSDPNGNKYTVYGDSVWFWDHETDERKKLSKDREEFFRSLKEPEEIDINFAPKMHGGQGWTDPDFTPEWD